MSNLIASALKGITRVAAKATHGTVAVVRSEVAAVRSLFIWDCSACGAKSQSGGFCGSCGTPRPAEPQEPKPKVCPACGRKAKEGHLHCTKCGASLSPAQPEPPAEASAPAQE